MRIYASKIDILSIFAKTYKVMRDIKDILAGDNIGSIISELQSRPYIIPEWTDLVGDYEPKLHKIVTTIRAVRTSPTRTARLTRPLG